MAKLPEFKKEKTIRDLQIGESCFTLPWAMIVDDKKNCYIQLSYPAHSSRGGTVQLKVILTEDGYICNIHDTQVNHEWHLCDISEYSPTELAEVIGFDQRKLDEMTKDELEQERIKAESSGNFEKAAEIRDRLQKL